MPEGEIATRAHLQEASAGKQPPYWTNRSVLKLAGESDPVAAVVRVARVTVLRAVEEGWAGPPFDPFQLATRLGIQVVASDDVQDARLVPSATRGAYIQFNPNRAPARVRFSVAHELAHTLFRDYAEAVRHRGHPQGDEWQLELLCNIAASEFLMPVGTAQELEKDPVDIDHLIRLRDRFTVSTEALLLRMVKLTRQSCAVFAAARVSHKEGSPVFRIDYVVPSRAWSVPIPRGLEVRGSVILSECAAVGFTSKGRERWNESPPEFALECVGIPAYPGELYPRIVGVVRLTKGITRTLPALKEVRGDATAPRGGGHRIVAQVVNDRTPNWGAGFARSVGEKWPSAQSDFIRWAAEESSHLALGNAHATQVSENITIFSMVAQRGYGPSRSPRLRYTALRNCLDRLAEFAGGRHASIHLPRIGTGFGGGDWNIIRELIDDALVSRGLEVAVYSAPNVDNPRSLQTTLDPRAADPR